MNRSQIGDCAVDVSEFLPSRRYRVSLVATCDSAWVIAAPPGQSFEPAPTSESTTTNAPSLICRSNNDGSTRNDVPEGFAACSPPADFQSENVRKEAVNIMIRNLRVA